MSKYNIPKDIITIKKIKYILVSGTSVSFKKGEFIKKIIAEFGQLYTEDEIEEIMWYKNGKENTNFGRFLRNGNLRTERLYALKDVLDRLKRVETGNGSGAAFEMLCDAFDNFFKYIKSEISTFGLYLESVKKDISVLITPQNTYYCELFEYLNQHLEIKEKTKDNLEDLKFVLASLVLLAILQDDVFTFLPDLSKTKCKDTSFFPHTSEKQILNKNNTNRKNSIPLSTVEMFRAALTNKTELGNIAYVDMSFHGGSEWQRDSDKVEILRKIRTSNIKLRIIVNNDLIKDICSHMAQPDKRYTDFNEGAFEWFELSYKYPELIEVRIAKVPLLHRTYIIRGEKNIGWANIKYYTYGNYIPDKDNRICFDNTELQYQLYVDEYEYLWNHASYQLNSIPSITSPFDLSNLRFSDSVSNKISSEQYYNIIEQNIENISLLQIVCHSGDTWLRPDSKKYSILKKLCALKTPVQVLINSPEATNVLWQYMRDEEAYKMGMYRNLSEIIESWKRFATSAATVSVRMSGKPFLHNCIFFSLKDGTNSLMRVGLYKYKEHGLNLPHLHFYVNSDDSYGAALRSEFSYLWNCSDDIIPE